MSYIYKTCEAVGFGHPDKVADRISDEILDFLISKDKNSRAGIETLISNQTVVVGGEYRSSYDITQEDIEEIINDIFKYLGYIDENGDVLDGYGIDKEFIVQNYLKHQSEDIAIGIELNGEKIGAGDQGMMIGYSSKETEELLPMPLVISNEIMNEIRNKITSGVPTLLMPDGKCQVTVAYLSSIPMFIDTIVVSNQTKNNDRAAYVKEILEIIDRVVKRHKREFLPTHEKNNSIYPDKIFINPTGSFTIGGPLADVGLTGRKIVADQYGGFSPVGGGALSGKDATKVDRSGAYMARCLANNILRYFDLESVGVELSYAIGVPEPVSVNIDVKGKKLTSDMNKKLRGLEKEIIKSKICTPYNIMNRFGLGGNIKFSDLSVFGHYGRNMPWDKDYDDIFNLIKLAEIKY